MRSLQKVHKGLSFSLTNIYNNFKNELQGAFTQPSE